MDLTELPAHAFRRHPWERARLSFFSRLLRDRGVLERTKTVLDVGAGDGWFLEQLLEAMPAARLGVGWDVGYVETQVAVRRRIGGAELRLSRDVPTETFGLVLMLDVIEHTEDDIAFVKQSVSLLEPGGIALVSVPAWQALFTSHDVALRHFRRYSPTACETLLRNAGLRVMARGGLFHTLLLPRAVRRLREGLPGYVRAPEPPLLEWSGGPLTTGVVRGLLTLDTSLSLALARAGVRAPGLSYWALCEKAGVPGPSAEGLARA